jgi:hypothetical protein
MAILVILVLTIIGIGVAYFTQIEDRTSGNAKLEKLAFYGAETGLREGESLLSQALEDLINLDTFLSPPSGTTALTPPGGGRSASVLRYGTVTYLNRIITPTAGASEATAYTIYVRNNLEDRGMDADDTDSVINIVVVGSAVTLRDVGGTPTIDRVLMTKILEEQLYLVPTGTEAGSQKGANQGGTGAGSR